MKRKIKKLYQNMTQDQDNQVNRQ